MTTASSGTAVVTLPTDTQILITREFAAPKHLVYKAWTTPDLIKRFVMVTNGGFEVAFHGAYRELIENERIVSTRSTRACPTGRR